MRVVQIAPSYCRQDGGPSEVLRGLLPELEKLGVDVALVTTDKGLSDDERAHPPTANTTALKFKGPYSLSYAAGFAGAVRQAVEEAQVVHVHGVDNYASAVGMREAARAGVPFVVQPHGAWGARHRAHGRTRKSVWNAVVQRRWLVRATRVIASSAVEAADARALGSWVVASRVPLGVDSSVLGVSTPWPDRSGVLFLGRIAPDKGLDLVMRSLARMTNRPRLTVAGPASHDLEYDPIRLGASLGLGKDVDFVGQVDRAGRLELLSTRRVFVAPSESESFGLAVAEAAAAGLLVVAPAEVGALADAAAAGCATPTRRAEEDIAAALALALSSDEPAEVDALRDYARTNWSWPAAARTLVEVYREVLS